MEEQRNILKLDFLSPALSDDTGFKSLFGEHPMDSSVHLSYGATFFEFEFKKKLPDCWDLMKKYSGVNCVLIFLRGDFVVNGRKWQNCQIQERRKRQKGV